MLFQHMTRCCDVDKTSEDVAVSETRGSCDASACVAPVLHDVTVSVVNQRGLDGTTTRLLAAVTSNRVLAACSAGNLEPFSHWSSSDHSEEGHRVS